MTKTGRTLLALVGAANRLVMIVVALAVEVVGLAWMVRIFRRPRDEAPPWRYRDR
jgi:hypothetical protein